MISRKLNNWVAWAGALFAALAHSACAGEVNAAVAANFTAPAEKIASLFTKQSGHTVKLSFGASGKLYAQIQNDAPFDVLLAADEKYPMLLEQQGLGVAGTRFVYAQGRLVLWSAQPGFVDARGEVLRLGKYNKLAYADPKLAPYGQAAKQALDKLGLWNAVQGKLVTGESIAQTWQFAASGNAEMAFIALSQISNEGKVSDGSWWLVPSNLYNPIRQGAVLLSGAKDPAAARAFLAFLKSDQAMAVIRSYGYESPR